VKGLGQKSGMIGEKYYPLLVAAFGGFLLFSGLALLGVIYMKLTEPPPPITVVQSMGPFPVWPVALLMLAFLIVGSISVVYSWSLVRSRRIQSPIGR